MGVLFAITSATVVAKWLDLAPAVSKFLEDPLILASLLTVLIWLGLGRDHVIVRLSVSVLAITCLFFLGCFDSLYLYEVPWNQFVWTGLIRETLYCLSMPLWLILISLPLACCRRRSDTKNQFAIRHLLFSIACCAISLAIGIALIPYPGWFVDFGRQAIASVEEPKTFFLSMLLPLYGTTLAFIALGLWWKRCKSVIAIIGILLGSSVAITLAYLIAQYLIWDELTFGWKNVIYLSGGTIVSVAAVFVTLLAMEKSLVDRPA